MRLEKKHEEELDKRRGLASRTLIQIIWLIISFTIAFFLVDYLFGQDYISFNMVYQAGIPRIVPEWAITLVLMIFVVAIMQFLLFMGYAFTSPEGRRRTGDPTLKSRARDPYDYGQD